MKIHNKIQHFRESKNISRKELAQRVGVTERLIQYQETGAFKDIGLSTAIKIADVLETPLADIFFLPFRTTVLNINPQTEVSA